MKSDIVEWLQEERGTWDRAQCYSKTGYSPHTLVALYKHRDQLLRIQHNVQSFAEKIAQIADEHHESKVTNKSNVSSSSNAVQIIAITSTTSTTTGITTDSSGQIQENPVIISLPDPATSGMVPLAMVAAEDDNAMDTNIHNSLSDDLPCVICRRIDLSAKNRLIECSKCTSLYHQECHSPQIKDSDLVNGQELSWCCSNCKVKKFKSSHLGGSPSESK